MIRRREEVGDTKAIDLVREKIREAMKAKGVTVGKLSLKTKQTDNTIYRFLDGRHDGTLELIESIAIALDVPVTFLLP